jgi:hypothetical protein
VLPALLVLAVVARVLLALYYAPASDVFYYITQAVQALLGGTNPYGHPYAGIPPSLVTPGAERVLAYFPGTLIYSLPFYLAGDIRYGFVTADLVIGTCLYLFGGRWRKPAAAVYLLAPFTVVFSTVYIDAALAAMAFLALSLLLEARGRSRLGAVAFGAALASSQFVIPLLPLAVAYHLRRGRRAEPAIAITTAALVVLPFLVASPPLFLSDTLSFELTRPLAPLIAFGGAFGFTVNPSLAAVVAWLSGSATPLYLRAVPVVVAAALLLRASDVVTYARNSAAVVLVTIFAVPGDFYWAYAELPFMLLLFWLSSRTSAVP